MSTCSYVANEFNRHSVAAWGNVRVFDENVEDIVLEFRALTGCRYATALGNYVDDLGQCHFLFEIPEKDIDSFTDARMDTRYRGEFAWAREISFFGDF